MPPEYPGLNWEEVEPEALAFVATETQYQAGNEKGDNGESGVVYLVVARRLQFAQLQADAQKQMACRSRAISSTKSCCNRVRSPGPNAIAIARRPRLPQQTASRGSVSTDLLSNHAIWDTS
jgi:hypothetical protein